MKQILKYSAIFSLMLFAAFLTGCDDDEELLEQVTAGFTQNVEEAIGEVTFLNTSENAEDYSWDFGDGTSSTEINPTKTYATGVYIVELTATKGTISDTFSDTITISVPLPARLPIDFDDSNTIYEPTTFNGAAFSMVTNPDLSGSNTTASTVGQITNAGVNFEGLFFDLGAPIDFTTDKAIRMNFWSDTPIDVLLKLEEGTSGDIELAASHGGTGWEEISFIFNSTASYNKFTFFVDAFGTASGDFFFDDIAQVDASGVDMTGPVITLNGAATIDLTVGDAFTDPGATALDNVDGDVSANIVVAGDVVDVNTAATYVITYNVSDAAGNAATEVTRTVNVSAAPVTLFPMTFENGESFTGAFDGGANGANADNPDKTGINTSDKVYQFNKIANSAWYSGAFNIFSQDIDPTGGKVFSMKVWSPNANINFRFQLEKEGNQGPIVTYNLDKTLTQANQWVEMVFDFSGTAINLADGYDKIVIFPDYDETNMVPVNPAAIYYFDDIDQSAGSSDTEAPVITLNGASTIDLDIGDAFTDPGATAMDNVDGDISANIVVGGDMVDVNTMGIYTITYDVSDAAGNAAIQVTRTVRVGIMSLFPLDFEDGGTLTGAFDGGANGANADNPDQSGINTSSKVYQFNKIAGSAWYSGAFHIFGQDIDPAGGESFTMKVWSPNANINFRFQLEKEGNQGPIVTYQLDQTLTTANEWVEMTFDFSSTGLNLADGYDKIVIFPDYDDGNQVPVDPAAIYYFDDINQGAASGADTEAPVITLLGDATISVAVGGTFTDPGATAMDNVDGDISANIVVGGDMVDVNTEANYTITYNVSDAAGNAATQVTRAVVVGNPPASGLPLDFEDGGTLTGSFDGGANGANADNPDPSGINTSAKVYQFNKIAGSAWYSGAFHIFAQDIDATGGTTFKVKVWSPNANINFRFQLEKEGNQGPIVTYQVDQTLTTANQWVELTFDFSGTPLDLSNGYDKIVIFPDYDDSNQVPVDPAAIYYFDDFTQE